MNSVVTSNNHQPSFITVVGASAGGLNALSELVAQLSQDMDIAAFLVLHLSAGGIGDLLRDRLQKVTPLTCKVASDHAVIEKGHVYIAPADHHLVIKPEHMKIVNDPVENLWRPSIDVLFRSAAVAYGERVIGIVLTGMLNDGTAGMMAIRRCGGTCIVQDPNEAEYPDMPISVINNMEVDYCIPLAQMGFVIHEITLHKEIKG